MPGSCIAGNLVALGIHALFIGNVITPLRIVRCVRAFTRTNHAAGHKPRRGTSTTMTFVTQRSRCGTDDSSRNDRTGEVLRSGIVARLAHGLLGIIAAVPIFLRK